MGTIIYISLTIIVFVIIIFLQTRHIPKFALDFIQDHPIKIKLKWNPNENEWQFIIRFRICWFLFFPIWVTHHRTFFNGSKQLRLKMFFKNYQDASDYINKKRDEYRYFYQPIISRKNKNSNTFSEQPLQKDFNEVPTDFEQEQPEQEFTAEEQFKEVEKIEQSIKLQEPVKVPDILSIEEQQLIKQSQILTENELLSKSKKETLPEVSTPKKKAVVRKKPKLNIPENEKNS